MHLTSSGVVDDVLVFGYAVAMLEIVGQHSVPINL